MCLPEARLLVALALTQDVGVLLQRAASELGLGPQVGRQETIGAGDGSEGSLQRVLQGLGGTGRSGVGVVHTGQLEQTLDSWRGDQAGTTGRGDQLHGTCQQMLRRMSIRLFE